MLLNRLKEELSYESIPTGSQELDHALRNGLRTGAITEITGNSGTGKTQLCLQLTMNTILPKPVGLIAGEVVFISTRRDFCPQRVIQMIDRCVEICESRESTLPKGIQFTRKTALKSIHHKLVSSVEELIKTVYQLKSFVKSNKNIRLIVIDSFSATLRNLDTLDRIRVTYELLSVLTNLSIITELERKIQSAVILTNGMTTQINDTEQSNQIPELGEFFHHRIHQRIILTKEDKQQVLAHVKKNLINGPSIIKLQITATGVKSA